MNSKQLFYSLVGLSVFCLIAIIGGTMGLNNMLVKQAQPLLSSKASYLSLQTQQTELTQAKKDIQTYSNLYGISKTVVPQSKNQTEAVRQITNIAGQDGVTVQSITFQPSTLGNTLSGAPSTAPAAGTSVPISAGTNPTLSQLQKVPGIPGVYAMQLTVQSSSDPTKLASYQQLINFLSSLEQNRLTASVSNISIQPSTTVISDQKGIFQFSLVLNIYINPRASNG